MREGLNRLLKMWKPNQKWLLISIVLTIGGAIGTLAIPALSQTLINEGISGNNLSVIIQYGGYMLILTLAAAACQIVNTMIAVKFSEMKHGEDRQVQVLGVQPHVLDGGPPRPSHDHDSRRQGR